MVKALSISDYQKLGIKRSFEMFGGTIAFKRVTQYVVTFVLGSLSNSSGEMISISEFDALQNASDYVSLSVGGVSISNAKIVGFELKSGVFNKNAVAELTYEVSEGTNDLSSLSGAYAALGAGLNSQDVVDEISESVTVSCGENSASFSKQVNIAFGNAHSASGADSSMARRAASFAKAYFNADASGGTIPDLGTETVLRRILSGSFKKFTSETIDSVTNSCSFTQTLSVENVVGSFSKTFNLKISINKDGLATVTESGEAMSLTDKTMSGAEAAYAEASAGAATRMQTMFNTYYGNRDPESPLNAGFVSSSRTYDPYRGKVSYSFTMNNDKKYGEGSGDAYHSSTLSYSIENGICVASQRGTIEGISSEKYKGTGSGTGRWPKFQQAYNFFQTIKSTAKSNAHDYAEEFGNASASEEPISRSETLSLLQGTVQYEFTYSTDERYSRNEEFKLVEVSSKTDFETEKTNEFMIVNEPILIQRQDGANKGTYRVSAKVMGYHGEEFDNLLGEAISQINASTDAGDYDLIENATASCTKLNDETLDLSVEFTKGIESPS